MDFGSLIYTAHKNEKSANKDVKCYKTKFEPPKKEVKSRANLSANIQKYLQKRDEEERKKADEEKKKKEELLALRSQDRKSFKRVQTMLKRTKSANKSVMEDAIDNNDTVITMAGPQQCDEDDYGYVSQEASALYAKLMDKYSSMPPEEPKFPQARKQVVKDLNAAKDRVKAALQKEEEEELMPHKRKRKSKSDKLGGDDGDDNDQRSRESSPAPVEEPKQKKPKKMAPPPIDFSSLLKLAEQKQFEPIKIEKKVKDGEDERPMTKKEKLEYERERERRERKMERDNAMKNAQRRQDTVNRIPKLSESGERKDKPNGLGRIPKKSDAMGSRPKSDGSNDVINRNNHHNNDRAISSKQNGLKSSQDHNKNYSERNGYKERLPNNSDNDYSDSQSGSDSRNYHPTKRPTVTVSHKHRPQVKFKYEHDERSYSKQSKESSFNQRKDSDNRRAGSPDRNRFEKKQIHSYSDSEPEDESNRHINSSQRSDSQQSAESENERSPSPQDFKYDNKHRKSYADSEAENENQTNYPPKRQKLSSEKSSKRFFNERGKERSNPSHSSDKRRQSYSGSELEDERKYEPPKKQISSKAKKISSLFEGSDNEESYHDNRIHKDEIKKPKLTLDSEKQKSSMGESKFKIPKTNSKPDLDRKKVTAVPDKYKTSNMKKSSSSSKPNMPEKYNSLEKTRPSSSLKPQIPEKNKTSESTRPSSSRPQIPQKYKSSSSTPSQNTEKYNSSENRRPSSSSKSQITKVNGRPLPNHSKSDGPDPRSISDENKSRFSEEKSRNKSESSQKESSNENAKKPAYSNAEEALKKSSAVWSKPCNLSPATKPTSGLSESQIQRLREMNKKPMPAKPVSLENRSSQLGRSSPRDERKSDGRPSQLRPGGISGKPNMLKAAAAAAANRSVAQKSQQSSTPRDVKTSPKPPERQPVSRPTGPKPSSSQPTKDARPKQFPPSDLKPRQFPPSDLKPRQFPPKDVRGRQFPPPDVKRRPKPHRIEDDDSEEEYDSEMDDFIDDGTDMNQEAISKEIQSIFGYDKSRYYGIDDDDDECMESNFGQIDREEYNSLRIGAREDYEELMKEMAEKKMKRKKKLEMMRRNR